MAVAAATVSAAAPAATLRRARRPGTARARSGTLRAVIFGVSDGLVSNLSLVMGVAGAAPDNPASSCSRASPDCWPARSAWPPASTSRCRASASCSSARSRSSGPRWRPCPRREAELAAIYRAKGFTADERRIAHRIFQDPATALDTLVREELGLDPDELGSPWGAAAGSFVAFAVGAFIPVVPYLFGARQVAVVAVLGLSLIALFAVGAAVSLLTGRGLIFSGARQMVIGLAAAVVAYAIGSIIGVAA